MFWDMEDERVGRSWWARSTLRLVARAARWEMQRPVLDGPFTETKEMLAGPPRRSRQA